MFYPSKINSLVNRESNEISSWNLSIQYSIALEKTSCFILVYRDFMSQVLKIVLTVHCVYLIYKIKRIF